MAQFFNDRQDAQPRGDGAENEIPHGISNKKKRKEKKKCWNDKIGNDRVWNGRITEDGSGGFVDGGAEVAPSVRGLGAHLEAVDGLLAQAGEGRFRPVDEHVGDVVLIALHEVAHLVHLYVRVRIVGRIPAERQLGGAHVDDAHVGYWGRDGSFRRHGYVDELVLVGGHLLRDAVVGKHLEPVRRHRVQS